MLKNGSKTLSLIVLVGKRLQTLRQLVIMEITNVDSQPIPRIANPNKSGDRFSLSEFGILRARNGMLDRAPIERPIFGWGNDYCPAS